MPKTNKISITGDLGSGKSTIAHLLAERLEYNFLSSGGIHRQIADRYNMSTLELNQYAMTHPEIDEEVDASQRALTDNADPYVVDSRLAWFFIPNSFKVYLQVAPDEAVRRIMNDPTRKSEHYTNPQKAVEDILERKKEEGIRFLKVYGADCNDMSNFDLVIDTTHMTMEKVLETILEEFQHLSK